ncbi:hypothetical protein RND81_08G167400 [Saponaria officinalis]|uniref:ZCF37 n=1 Tax=Saponaria officinalis TaxID=3572 RepID=A0AAW1JBJ6_SAPOF
MLSSLICGTSVLPRDEEDEHERKTRSAESSPRKSRSSSHKNNNPYSTRGLDRFSALLSEIEQKRQKIYSEVDPNEISLVRFVYTGDHEFKPIIVKAKPAPNDITNQQQPEKQPKIYMGQKPLPSRKFSASFSSSSITAKEVKTDTQNETTTKKKESTSSYKRLWVNSSWVKPKVYLPMIIIMITVLLLLLGKSFAIMCTSIGWYVIPSIMNSSNSSSNSNRSFKKKDFATKRMSNNNKKVLLSEGNKSFKHPGERVYVCQRSS